MEVSVRQVKAALSEYLKRAAYGRERIVISSRGKPKAAMIGIDDLHPHPNSPPFQSNKAGQESHADRRVAEGLGSGHAPVLMRRGFRFFWD